MINGSYSFILKLSFTQYSFRIGLEVVFASDNERAEMFKKMDDNGDGAISFDEWLAFSLEHIIAKVIISFYVTINLSNYLLIYFIINKFSNCI